MVQTPISCSTVFFNSRARSKYPSCFSLSFNFTLWLAGTAKSTILQVPRGVCASHFPGQILSCVYLVVWSNLNFLHNSRWIIMPTQSCLVLYFFCTIITPLEFFNQRYLFGFHWNLSDSKSPQVSRTLLSILAVLNNAVIWVVSTRPPTSKSPRPFNNPLVILPKAPITIGTIVSLMFHSIFNSLARSRYLFFFSHSFSFILWSAGTAKFSILQILFFFFLLIIIRSGLLAEIR